MYRDAVLRLSDSIVSLGFALRIVVFKLRDALQVFLFDNLFGKYFVVLVGSYSFFWTLLHREVEVVAV